MSRLLAKIMLALLMLPIGVTVYGIVALLIFETWGSRETTVFMATGVITAVVIAVYWMLLWRGTVRWTRERVLLTVMAGVAALVAGAVAGAIGGESVDPGFGAFLWSPVAVLAYLLLTVFAWRETGAERISRLRGAKGNVIVCPRCGYNLTGLAQAACPECGSRYTLEELMAGQRGTGAELDEDA